MQDNLKLDNLKLDNLKLDNQWPALLDHIVRDDELHGRWLATLSHMENCGARKIMAYQPYLSTPLEVLQHAAEECRHAFFFKKQISKLGLDSRAEYPLLAGLSAKRYIHRLDVGVARLLKARGFEGRPLQEGCYLLTTYCIELRAEALYSLYDKVLQRKSCVFSLRSVLKEEKAHLGAMEAKLAAAKLPDSVVEEARAWEEKLFLEFGNKVKQGCKSICSPIALS